MFPGEEIERSSGTVPPTRPIFCPPMVMIALLATLFYIAEASWASALTRLAMLLSAAKFRFALR